MITEDWQGWRKLSDPLPVERVKPGCWWNTDGPGPEVLDVVRVPVSDGPDLIEVWTSDEYGVPDFTLPVGTMIRVWRGEWRGE